MLRIALGQLAVTGDKAANLEKITRAIATAAEGGARLAIFPEASMYYFARPSDPLTDAAEPLDGPFVRALSRLAQERRMWILAGMFESIPGDKHVYNTLVLLDEGGTLAQTYRKIHLYDAFGYKESERLRCGDGTTMHFTIDGTRFGALTCYDLRFPELARKLTREGADVIAAPMAWLDGPLKEMHLATLLRARAIENTVYVAAADQCGRGYSGNSALYDPFGVAVASGGEKETTIVAEIDPQRIADVRATNPSVANSRPDLYARWSEASAAAPSG